ncbi:MAG TPA: hypothetical protein VNZ86_15420 [Bacteroidia bacterium]|jgi:hypothetical protein|nr:hypothetical protein [Bacteroidia bacterium]
MKTNLRISLFAFLFAGLIIPSLQSCQKYPDGPFISLHTRTERVAQTWKVENYMINGNDKTSLYNNYSETYTQQGSYSYSWGVFSGSGTWAFADNDSDIQLSGISNQGNHTLVILKLEQKAFWYYYMDGNGKNEFHMTR